MIFDWFSKTKSEPSEHDAWWESEKPVLPKIHVTPEPTMKELFDQVHERLDRIESLIKELDNDKSTGNR
jgi:hypothetical protein